MDFRVEVVHRGTYLVSILESRGKRGQGILPTHSLSPLNIHSHSEAGA